MNRFSAVTAMLLLCAGFPAVAIAADEAAFISVEGVGEISARPDMAEVSAGVVSRAPTAREAVMRNNAAMPAVLKVLRDMKVADADIQTRGFSVSPFYSRTGTAGGTPEIAGYQVGNRIEVTVRNLSGLGSLLDRLVDAGANTIHGIRFDIGAPGPLRDAARRKAVDDARRRAELYAEAAGVRLGKVRRIEERALRMPQPHILASSEARALSAVPVSTGAQTIRVTIGVVFAIE